jgi:hypothetical protein
MNTTTAYAAEIVKYDRDENGDLIVYGKATGPDLDLDGQICDSGWLKSAMPTWMEFGNVREMHQPIAAGIGVELEEQGTDWMLKSKCIDPNTARKIESGVLKGYSVGIKNPQVTKDASAPGGRIVGGSIIEVSYVDRPCNPTAKMSICKGASATEMLPQEAPADDTEVSAPDASAATPGAESAKGDAVPAKTVVVAAEPGEGAPVSAAESAEKLLARGLGRTLLGKLNTVKFAGKSVSVDLAKAAPAEDIASAQAAIANIALLIQSEAQSLADGNSCDAAQISTLLCAIDSLEWFCTQERWEAEAEAGAAAVVVTVDGMELAAGVPDITKTPSTTTVASTASDSVEVSALRKQVESLSERLTKALSMPVPGGPVLTRSQASIASAEVTSERLAKAASFEHMAGVLQPTDPATAEGYRRMAAELRAK